MTMALLEAFKSAVRATWRARSHVPLLRRPIRCHLPDGSMFLAYGDTMGWSVFSRSIRGGDASYEVNEQRFIRRFLRAGMTVIDAGANQGFYSLLAAGCVGPTGCVLAFEPVQSEFEKLGQNAEVNHYTNISAMNCAVGASVGETQFFVAEDGFGTFSSRKMLADDLKHLRRTAVRVPLTTLDAAAEEQKLTRCDLVKIDVEGGELEVLRGAERLLQRFRPLVMCELADIRTATWNYPARDIYLFLERLGYRWYEPSSEGVLTVAPAQERYDPDWKNLVAVPKERAQEWASLLPELA